MSSQDALQSAFFTQGFDVTKNNEPATMLTIDVSAEVALAMGEITVKPEPEAGSDADAQEPEKDTLPASLGISSTVSVTSTTFVNTSNEKITQKAFVVEAIPAPGREGGFSEWLSEALQLDGLRFIPDLKTITFAQQSAAENSEGGKTTKSRLHFMIEGVTAGTDRMEWSLVFRKYTVATPKEDHMLIQFSLGQTVSASVDSLVRCMSPDAANTMSQYVQLALSFQSFAFARSTANGKSSTVVTLMERPRMPILKVFAEGAASKENADSVTKKTFISFTMEHCRPFAQLDGPAQLTDEEKKAVKEFRVCTRHFEIIDDIEKRIRLLVQSSPAGSQEALVQDVTPKATIRIEELLGEGIVPPETLAALIKQASLEENSDKGAAVAAAYSGQVAVRVDPVSMSAQRILFKYRTGYDMEGDAPIKADLERTVTVGLSKVTFDYTIAATQKLAVLDADAAKLASLLDGAIKVVQRLQNLRGGKSDDAIALLIGKTFTTQIERIKQLNRPFKDSTITNTTTFLDNLVKVKVLQDGSQVSTLKEAVASLSKPAETPKEPAGNDDDQQ